jgi:hypothetical protein
LEQEQPAAPKGARGGPGFGAREDHYATLRAAPGALMIAQPAESGDLKEEIQVEIEERPTTERLKNPSSSRTVISSTPADRSRSTRRRSHSSVPAAVWALPGRQRTPRQSPVSWRRPGADGETAGQVFWNRSFLGSRLLRAGADRDGGVQDQGELLRDSDQGPTRRTSRHKSSSISGTRAAAERRSHRPNVVGSGIRTQPTIRRTLGAPAGSSMASPP